ncbi:alpha/beta family hydrolase [Parasynechococcus marenigrum]|uniref:KANL3/Tex30 alpha/beta hydrolase-like domain-containing protein n=1 Tax=Parasynechococcus marenigrum (strain WH8102) TaxID=84588 RepID=Q7U688_PARMW|nr:alpha/beta family hydrolase [Parasynechococcus marenigrum]CAE07966.1 conserved hypothetical protein [Parasynechococcus marenigrum WH 8102]
MGLELPLNPRSCNPMADGLAQLNWRVHRFDFPYMARRRLTGQKTLPDRPDVLLKAFRDALDQLDQGRPLVIVR